MRIVHTADWHVGRITKGYSRLDEMEAVLGHLADFLETEWIDLLLVAGDVFETWSPSADAETIVFRFFRRLGLARIPSVVIAGNHDHPTRIDAWGTLARLAEVHVVGRPRSLADGGLVEIETAGGIAGIACLPFASARTWTQLLEDAGELVGDRSYHAVFRQAARHLCGGFRSGCVNLLMAHTHIQGAVVGASERPLHLTPDWAVLPADLPAGAQYVALGHVHRPQRIDGAPVETRFAGSPLQLDFGETGEEKSFVVLDAEPGKPVTTRLVPYEGGQTLTDVRVTLADIERDELNLRAQGWLRVTVPIEAGDPDLARKVRRRLPNALVVHAELPEMPELVAPRPALGASVPDLYRAYLKQHRGQDSPAAVLLDTFTSLYDSARGEPDASRSPVA
jgi:DNA repair protein SbcD/Mre11